jgi:hypothetical protein
MPLNMTISLVNNGLKLENQPEVELEKNLRECDVKVPASRRMHRGG